MTIDFTHGAPYPSGGAIMAYQVDCTEDDDFMVQSEDESEVIDVIKRHAEQKHGMDMNDDDVRDMMDRT